MTVEWKDAERRADPQDGDAPLCWWEGMFSTDIRKLVKEAYERGYRRGLRMRSSEAHRWVPRRSMARMSGDKAKCAYCLAEAVFQPSSILYREYGGEWRKVKRMPPCSRQLPKGVDVDEELYP